MVVFECFACFFSFVPWRNALTLTWSQGLHSDPRCEPRSLMTAEIFNRGPIACGVDASEILDYTSGIASGYSLSTDHGVSVVGWGNDVTEGKYWIVRYSWGEFWGEQRDIRVKAGWFSNPALAQQCTWPCLEIFQFSNVTTPLTVGRVVRIVTPRTSHPKPIRANPSYCLR